MEYWGIEGGPGDWLVVGSNGFEKRVGDRLAAAATTAYYLWQAGLRDLHARFVEKLPRWLGDLFRRYGPPAYNFYNAFLAEQIIRQVQGLCGRRGGVGLSGTAALSGDYDVWRAVQAAAGDVDVGAYGVACRSRVLRWVWANSYRTPRLLRDPRGLVADAGGRHHLLVETDGAKVFVDVDVEILYYPPRHLGPVPVADPVDAVRPRLPKYWYPPELGVLAQIPVKATGDPRRLWEAALESAARHGWEPVARGLAALAAAGWETAAKLLSDPGRYGGPVQVLRVAARLGARVLVAGLAGERIIRVLARRLAWK